jgi:uncharacterized protein (DUF1810 family)
MTLFAEVEGSSERGFHKALKKYFGGKTDEATLAWVGFYQVKPPDAGGHAFRS